MALFLGEHSIDLFAGQPVHNDVVLSSLYVTPSPTAQTFTPSIEIDGWDNVEVSAIPEEYIIPTGTISITTNGTHNVKDYASASVQIPKIVNLQNKSITPTESSQTVTADSGYDGLGEVSVGAISTTYVGTGIARKSSTDLTVSGATVSVPAGYYSAAASKSVASGTAGTPTASKGTVSNHSVSVTPSVTNITGYITGSTKTGTAVTVSASELVSGTYTVDSSGTKDVTNYASASVAAGTAGTPTATKGSVSNHSVNVTPSVINTTGWITGSTKTGTAVTVSASELVSGSETKTSNGTYDVTNLAELIINVPTSTGSVVVSDEANATGTTAVVSADDVTTLITKSITQNGTYNASSDSADGYSSVTVNVSGGSPSATQHEIHLEFSDSTDTDIDVYYDDALISTMITAYEPTTYGQKTVTLAQLDGVTWYEYDPSETWETLLEGNIPWNKDDNNDYPYCWISSLSSATIPDGSVWRITYDNVEYRLTAISGNIGNPKWGGGTDDGSNVPFVFNNSGWGAWTGSLNVPNVDSQYYFKIERLVTS